MSEQVTTETIRSWKTSDHKIAALTTYDATFGKLLDEAGIDIILVGDSAGNVFAGHDTTLPVTMEQMLYHVASVKRGVNRALVVADMPFGSYQPSLETGIANAIRFMKETEAGAVKLEGGRRVSELVRRLTGHGIPVMGHLGLTPQSIREFGSYHTRGTSPEAARDLLEDAHALEEAGAFAIVLEKIPAALAADITAALTIPTIGIGAGNQCDGQVLVLYDMLGLFDAFRPRFVRRYAELGTEIRNAVTHYIQDVARRAVPQCRRIVLDHAVLPDLFGRAGTLNLTYFIDNGQDHERWK